jgi:hypothetical protein
VLDDAYANPTPAMTGIKLISFKALNLPLKKTLEIKIVNKGVEARTTWWNYTKERSERKSAIA